MALGLPAMDGSEDAVGVERHLSAVGGYAPSSHCPALSKD